MCLHDQEAPLPGEYRISVERRGPTSSHTSLQHLPALDLAKAQKSNIYRGMGRNGQRWICLKGHEDMYMLFGIDIFRPADGLPHPYSRLHHLIVPENLGTM